MNPVTKDGKVDLGAPIPEDPSEGEKPARGNK